MAIQSQIVPSAIGGLLIAYGDEPPSFCGYTLSEHGFLGERGWPFQPARTCGFVIQAASA